MDTKQDDWSVRPSLRRTSSLSDGWDYARPPPFEPNVLPSSLDVQTRAGDRTNSGGNGTAQAGAKAADVDSSEDDGLLSDDEQPVHWTEQVFDGNNPVTPFKPSYQSQVWSNCQGWPDPELPYSLQRDGFVQAFELPFNSDQMRIALFHRPRDSRAKIVATSLDGYGNESHCCERLTRLKIFRNNSSLELCRLTKTGKPVPWATLNFAIHERMVLFYCSFIAMKRQDSAGVPSSLLIENSDQLGNGDGSGVEFAGVILDGQMRHALRIITDRGSGAVRLEASALRGPMKDVPIWTAFVTRYSDDPDWAELEDRYGGSDVSLIAMKPPPYVFLSGYHPTRSVRGEYTLRFDLASDARDFISTWAGICRNKDFSTRYEPRYRR